MRSEGYSDMAWWHGGVVGADSRQWSIHTIHYCSASNSLTSGDLGRRFLPATERGLYPYRWFSWGVASLPEGKSRHLCLAKLCTKYRLVSATLTPYYCCLKIEETASHKVKGSLYTVVPQAAEFTYILFIQEKYRIAGNFREAENFAIFAIKRHLAKICSRENLFSRNFFL